MTDELKPLLSCPFCGGKSKLIESHRFGPEDTTPHYWKVSCNVIGCNGAAVNIWHPSPEQAITAWNRRYEPKELPEWLKKKINGRIYEDITEMDQKSPIVLNDISTLKWVLSLRREDAE